MQDKQYIKGLISQDRKVLRAIYKNFAGRIANYIIQHGGSREDAKDVFQDALMITLKKVQSADFQLSSGFYTYLFSINKMVWYNKSRKKVRESVTIPDDNTLRDDQNIEQQLLARELDKVYEFNFAKLGEFCQRLLTLFVEKKTMTEIAQLLELKNEHTARTRKYRCREKLKKLIEADPKYSELVN